MDTETTAGTIEAVMIETKDAAAVMMIDAVDTTTETDMVEIEVDTIEDMMIEEVAMMTGIKVELLILEFQE